MANIIPIIFFVFIILFIIMFSSGFLFLIFTIKIRHHLKKYNHARWHDITYISGISGGSNPLRLFKYVYSNIDSEDEIVSSIKKKLRIFFKFDIIIFLLILLLIVIIFILSHTT